MFDWDRNGKTDWRDAYVFNEIINKDSGKPSGHPSPPASSKGMGCLFIVVFLFLFLISK